MPRRINTAESFWNRVGKFGSDCWPWLGFRDKDGYGQIRWNYAHMRTHRLAWILTNGEIPGGLVVRHKCDNPPCCNPAHLLLGTEKENRADAMERNRIPNGERHHQAKLTRHQVGAIRRLHAEGASIHSLARRFTIDRSVIQGIVRMELWRHIATQIPLEDCRK